MHSQSQIASAPALFSRPARDGGVIAGDARQEQASPKIRASFVEVCVEGTLVLAALGAAALFCF